MGQGGGAAPHKLRVQKILSLLPSRLILRSRSHNPVLGALGEGAGDEVDGGSCAAVGRGRGVGSSGEGEEEA